MAARYDQLLRSHTAITPLAAVDYPCTHAHHLYVVQLDTDQLGMTRDDLVTALQGHQVGTGLHFPAVHLKKYYRERYGYTRADCPQACKAADRIVSLPLYPTLREADVDRVVQALFSVTGHACEF